MRLSLVFQVFLARMAFGTLVALLPLAGLRAAQRHVRFEAVLVFVLAIGAAALYGGSLGPAQDAWPQGAAAWTSLEGGMPAALVGMAVAALVVNFAYGTFRRRLGRVALIAGVLVGAVAVLGTARFSAFAADPGALAVLALGGMLGGMLMAGINDAMVLGHFYLMIKGLPLLALQRAGRFVAAVLVARMALFGLVLWQWEGAAEVLLERELIWTTWRVMFGFVGPLVLLVMVKDTVRLKHTQAATGLLYVAVAFALMGELAAVYLEMHTGLPA
ncbi:MAG: hypothetical protein AB7T63_15525 [Planctomycetota bacterium]